MSRQQAMLTKRCKPFWKSQRWRPSDILGISHGRAWYRFGKERKTNLHDMWRHVNALDEIEIDENLHFVEEPIDIVERDVKNLKRRRIPLVKVRWNSQKRAEYTWEREDKFWKKYPHLFSEPVPSSSVAT
ncbi:hypothetical protein Tco_0849621 [Tanacetum coccineum]